MTPSMGIPVPKHPEERFTLRRFALESQWWFTNGLPTTHAPRPAHGGRAAHLSSPKAFERRVYWWGAERLVGHLL